MRMSASMSASFCREEQFKARMYPMAASACAADARARSSRCPSGVRGGWTTMRMGFGAVMGQHLPNAPEYGVQLVRHDG